MAGRARALGALWCLGDSILCKILRVQPLRLVLRSPKAACVEKNAATSRALCVRASGFGNVGPGALGGYCHLCPEGEVKLRTGSIHLHGFVFHVQFPAIVAGAASLLMLLCMLFPQAGLL